MRYLLTILGLSVLLGVSPVEARGNNGFDNEQFTCLALNVYHESRGESVDGQIAVGFVTLNRVASDRFPNTICGVVKQAKLWNGNPVRDRCQFSWWCDGRSDKPRNKEAWLKAKAVAYGVLDAYKRSGKDITNGSMWYHADYVNPKWSKNLLQTVRFDDHIFYAPK